MITPSFITATAYLSTEPMRITEAVRGLEDAQQFILSQGHVIEVMDIGLSVDSVVSLHLSKNHTPPILYSMTCC